MSTGVAVVTGGGAGIGRATARRLAIDGWQVAVFDIDPVSAIAAVQEFDGIGLGVDVSDRAACRDAVGTVTTEWGDVTTLVANAGIQLGGALEDMTEDDWTRLIGINVRGVAHCVEAVVPGMIRRERGSIVVTSSVNAISGAADMPVYDATKAAVLGLVRSLALRHGRDGIRVNAVCPGATLTDFHLTAATRRGLGPDDLRQQMSGYGALGRAAEPDEIAGTIRFLCGDDSSFVTGHALVVDGGVTLGQG